MVILPKETGGVSSRIGEGIGKGLENIAQLKMNQIARAHKAAEEVQAYSQFLPPEQAHMVARAPEKLKQSFLSELMYRNQQQQQENQWQQQQQQGYQQPTGYQNFMGQLQPQQNMQQRAYGQPFQGTQHVPFENPQMALQRQKMMQHQQEFQQRQQQASQHQNPVLHCQSHKSRKESPFQYRKPWRFSS